jgi:membrane associated rhomboid family serine protease
VPVVIAGAVIYFVYSLLLSFFKLVQTDTVLKDELWAAAVFGLICGVSYLIVRRTR